jgi:hypothetical protein
LFQIEFDQSKNLPPRPNLAGALARDAQRLSDDAEALRQREMDHIYELLAEEPERWDGLS